MDQYSRTGVVGRGATKATAERGEKIFQMVVDSLTDMINNAIIEDARKIHRKNKLKGKKIRNK